MPADTLSREEIKRWLADLDSHGADLFSPMPLEDLAEARADMTERLWKIAPAALRATLSEPASLASARAEGVRELADRIRAILENDAECCGNPDMRDIYAYDEHGNATDIIGAEPDGCCGCPVQRDPSMILAEVKAALSPPPAEPTGMTAEPGDWMERTLASIARDAAGVPEHVVEGVRAADGDRIVKPADPSAPVAPEGDWPIITQREVDGVEYALTRDGDDYSNVKAVLAKLVREKSAALEAENAALKAESAKLRGIAARLDGEAVLVSSADEIVTRRTMDEMRTLLQGGPDAER